MALKPITRQEQIIVGKNLEPITRMERFLKEYGGGTGGSVQSDWNQTDSSAADFIKNKPFGDVVGDTLVVDAIYSMEDLENCFVVAEQFVKVSDAAPTMDDFANGFTIMLLGETVELPPEEIPNAVVPFVVDGALMIADAIVSVSEQAVGVDLEGIVFPEAGTYIGIEAIYKSSLSITINNYTGYQGVKTLDPNYLPNNQLYTDMTYLYKTSDTSDASNRITRSELKTYVKENSVIKILVSQEAATGFFFPSTVSFTPDFGAVFVGFGNDFVSLYTAEYTP